MGKIAKVIKVLTQDDNYLKMESNASIKLQEVNHLVTTQKTRYLK